MDRPNEPTLFGLPAELRTRILELVVFHNETNGIISPVCYVQTNCRKYRDGFYRNAILVSAEQDGVRFEERVDCTAYGPPNKSCDTSRMSQQDLKEHKHMLGMWLNSANSKNSHFCKLECLLQPSVSMVNAQLRRESLFVFYGINQFHLEMDNFHLHTHEGECTMANKSPADWYRAIGDDNIRAIRRLSLGAHSYYFLLQRSADKLVEEEWSWGPNRFIRHSQVHDVSTVLKIKDFAQRLRISGLGWNNTEQQPEGQKKPGLHVQLVEALVATIEPHIGRHLGAIFDES